MSVKTLDDYDGPFFVDDRLYREVEEYLEDVNVDDPDLPDGYTTGGYAWIAEAGEDVNMLYESESVRFKLPRYRWDATAEEWFYLGESE